MLPFNSLPHIPQQNVMILFMIRFPQKYFLISNLLLGCYFMANIVTAINGNNIIQQNVIKII
jgi:hypothetical protein